MMRARKHIRRGTERREKNAYPKQQWIFTEALHGLDQVALQVVSLAGGTRLLLLRAEVVSTNY
jgi:hypothetical protein